MMQMISVTVGSGGRGFLFVIYSVSCGHAVDMHCFLWMLHVFSVSEILLIFDFLQSPIRFRIWVIMINSLMLLSIACFIRL